MVFLETRFIFRMRGKVYLGIEWSVVGKGAASDVMQANGVTRFRGRRKSGGGVYIRSFSDDCRSGLYCFGGEYSSDTRAGIPWRRVALGRMRAKSWMNARGRDPVESATSRIRFGGDVPVMPHGMTVLRKPWQPHLSLHPTAGS